MPVFDPILVPHDGSPWSDAAVTHARLLAAATGARTLLAHVLPAGATSRAGYAEAARDARSRLLGEARRFRTAVDVVVSEGDPCRAILALAEAASLTVVGTRARTEWEARLFGSTTRSVLRCGSGPVLVVHRDVPSIRTLVAGVDDAPASEGVTRSARRLADALGAHLQLAVVVEGEAGRERAERVFGSVRGCAGGAEERVFVGRPVRQLREAAGARAAEVVVVGRRGASGTDVGAWGSVAFSLAIEGPFATMVV